MCATCGCGADTHEHEHHEHEHEQQRHATAHRDRHLLEIEQDVLAKNGRIAEQNRGWLKARRVVLLNLVSSPGSGKTSLLERTVGEAGLVTAVIEGDQATERDAARIRAAGAPAVQINTGTGCHLDAHMVAHALEDLDPRPGTTVFVENVGNLVCPALFDLGEAAKVLVASVAEGDDKPLKYPHMFRAAALVLLNKTDLLPHVPFDSSRFAECLRQVNPRAPILQVSATRGDGLAAWYGWLRDRPLTSG
jgi:hydrogenase nickel incorporation protein HypB